MSKRFFRWLGKVCGSSMKPIAGIGTYDTDNPESLVCPVCGYYCSGRGGYGCIDKPFWFREKPKAE